VRSSTVVVTITVCMGWSSTRRTAAGNAQRLEVVEVVRAASAPRYDVVDGQALRGATGTTAVIVSGEDNPAVGGGDAHGLFRSLYSSSAIRITSETVNRRPSVRLRLAAWL
jgi:hypothetical protein